jgi:anhydro-N-acetylmuramic acid kinase
LAYDEDAKIARSGNINEALLSVLLSHSFFNEKAPKTTGPELFNLEYVEKAQQQSGASAISKEDLVATLSALTAKSIADFISDNFKADHISIFTSGGGARNPYIITYLKKALPGLKIHGTGDLGIDPDAKEAILFALLGNEALCGEPLHIGDSPAVLMGKFSFPI